MQRTEDQIRKIIVIDDQSDIHNDFKQILMGDSKSEELSNLENLILGEKQHSLNTQKITYKIDSAYQGEEGYNKIKESLNKNEPYHLAFVDMRMPPGWDGLETIEQILKIDRNIQIVICTAYSDYSWEDISKRLGTVDNLLILKKPFDVVEVAQLARNLTEKWILAKYARLKMEDLEKRVEDRTSKIKEMEKSLYHTSKLVALGSLAGGIAHELSTPLAVIQGTLDLIKEMDTSGIFSKYTLRIDNSIERMSTIINHLRIFCRQNVNSKYVKAEIHNIINSTLDMILKQLETMDIKINKNFIQGDVFVNCNIVELEQVFLNLFLNSKDAMEIVKERNLFITTEKNTDKMKIIIEDTGTGISEEIKERIFEPFFTTKEIGKGTGLGLSISFGLIKKHGGNIELLAKDKKQTSGAAFVIELPLASD